MATKPRILDETEEIFSAAEQQTPDMQARRMRDAAMPIVSRLSGLATDAMAKRKDIERRWLEDMCQFAGVRSVGEISIKPEPKTAQRQTFGSQVFVNLTQPKTNRTEGRLCDILFPADDRNWGIEPTPVPELQTVARRGMEEAERAAAELDRLEQGQQSLSGLSQGELLSKAADLGEQAAEAQAVLDEAKRRARRMSTEIDDQLVECLYAQKSRDAISWACKLGVGILKGPVVLEGGRKQWGQREDGAYELNAAKGAAMPSVECTSPWAFFPDPSASTMADAEYVLERHLPSKREMRRLARRLGFDREVVKELLEKGPDYGSGDDLKFLQDMRLLTGESTAVTDRYVVWEYHGQLTVDEIATLIRARGGEDAAAQAEEYEANADPLDDRMVIIWFCNGQMLKLSEYYPMDSGDLIYSVFSLEKGNASILGAIGVPRMMRDSQQALNAAWRMMMDNGALSAIPQVLIDKKAVTPADNDWQMRPGKEWLFDSENGGATPFQVFNLTINQEELAGIIALAQAFIDEETAMPRVAEGVSQEGQPNNTPVGTMSMMMNSAGVNVRRMVKNWDDDVTTGMIRRIYDWNMQYSDKEEIKGDMCVEARGTSALLVQEMQAQNLSAITTTWTTHPVLGPMCKPYDLARQTLQSLKINPADGLITEEEYNKKIDALAQQDGEPEDPQWQVRKEIAMLDAEVQREKMAVEREIAMLKLAEQGRQTIAEIDAELEKARISEASKERTLAVEIAAEDRNARRAEAMGREPAGSGGFISAGTDEK